MKSLLIYIGIIFIPYLAYGQSGEPINTDRPDQSDGTYTLTAKTFQIETGLTFSQTENQFTDIIQSTMFRYGLYKQLEVRVLIDEGFNSNDAFKTNSFGLYPVRISAKQSLCKQNRMWPAITLVGYLKIPFTATKAFQIIYFAPSVLLAFQNDFNEKLSLDYNAGITWDGAEKQNFYLATASLSYALSNKLSAFGEYFSMFNKINSPGQNIDFGALYLIRSQLQIDLAAGSSLFKKSQSIFETCGVSYRFK